MKSQYWSFFLIALSFVRGRQGKHSNEFERKLSVEPVTGRFILGEGPHWDHETQKLFFVDITARKINRLDPSTGVVTSAFIPNGTVSVVIPVAGEKDLFVAGVCTDFTLVKWDSNKNVSEPETRVLASVDVDCEHTRWNDGKVDSSGRFWGGTMGRKIRGVVPPNRGSLYRITGRGVVSKMLSPVSISNGIAWSPDDNTMYYVDSDTYQVAAFDYNAKNGTISNKRVVFDTKKQNLTGIPDGMTIDTNGNLWIAMNEKGRAVIHVNPKRGSLLRSVEIPADDVSSVIFGGPFLDTLFVTTASDVTSERQLEIDPYTGSVFAVKGLGVRGMIGNSYKISN